MIRTFAEIPGYPPGSTFQNRRELHDAGVHRPLQGGISGSAGEGADSIVVSGGYEDDEDYGDEIVYTGHGGNQNGLQVRDQQFDRGNRALAVSCTEGLPVRVVRGQAGDPVFSPRTGFRYDGLFYVADYWSKRGRSGHRVYLYRLHALDAAETVLSSKIPEGQSTPGRISTSVHRVVRSTEVTQWVKERHDHRCQICGTRLDTPAGPYAEGAHIRPLGRPHDGPDVPGNVLCLCPNHHVQFDRGAITITSQHEIQTGDGRERGHLNSVPEHLVDTDHLTHHRERHAL